VLNQVSGDAQRGGEEEDAKAHSILAERAGGQPPRKSVDGASTTPFGSASTLGVAWMTRALTLAARNVPGTHPVSCYRAGTRITARGRA